MTFKEVTERNSEWKRLALIICKDYDLAQDVLQDMYIKLMNKDHITKSLVGTVLRQLFLDYCKKRKTERLSEGYSIRSNDSTFTPDDEEQEYLDRYNELPYIQKEFIAESYDRSLREIGETYSVNYALVNRQKHKGIEYVLGDKYKDFKDNNMKYKKPKKED